ncbi:hypothetical protein [Enterococcus faecalis]|uniref:hypothetical protein n=1 Tax=Enterococcus faecalis TaxID=1351 RepID=UPI002DB7988C|nr:hypothetical protein [Enterococcus faecalis]MEB7954592.1 hypothetical protein [Enterococcus faecalis]MEB7964742.1 hypothetical protein [Enterococcus faecalis]
MKKILLGIIFLLSVGLFFIDPSKASADEIDDFLDKYNLSGAELDNFEVREQVVRQKKVCGLDESAVRKEKADLIKR